VTCCWLNNFLLDLMDCPNVHVGRGAPLGDDGLWLSGPRELRRDDNITDRILLEEFFHCRSQLVDHLLFLAPSITNSNGCVNLALKRCFSVVFHDFSRTSFRIGSGGGALSAVSRYPYYSCAQEQTGCTCRTCAPTTKWLVSLPKWQLDRHNSILPCPVDRSVVIQR
jgi:hypothetical protein